MAWACIKIQRTHWSKISSKCAIQFLDDAWSGGLDIEPGHRSIRVPGSQFFWYPWSGGVKVVGNWFAFAFLQVQCNNILFAMPMPYAIGKAHLRCGNLLLNLFVNCSWFCWHSKHSAHRPWILGASGHHFGLSLSFRQLYGVVNAVLWFRFRLI